jgi:glycosyltransferase involved in cell wall biosynthesis
LGKKNVLYIGSVYPVLHGASVAAKHFVEGMMTNGNNVLLLNTIYNKNLNTIERFSINKILRFIYYFYKLIVILLFKKIDTVVLMHSFRWAAFFKDSIFIKLCLVFKKKVILYAQGEGFLELFYNDLTIKKKQYIDNVLKRVFKIVVVSNSLKKEYIQWINPDKIFVVYNICDPIIGKNEIVERNNRNNINLLFLSTITEGKGIFDLLKAFNELQNFHNNIKLIVCGDFLLAHESDKLKYFRYIEDYQLSDFVEYRGRVVEEEKKRAFTDADIFVLPTHRESFGIVNIEAMSAGLPVVSTYQGAIPEYIEDGENGFLYNPGDYAELAEKLKILIENESLRKSIGEKNRRKFFELFSRKKFIDSWDMVINENKY